MERFKKKTIRGRKSVARKYRATQNEIKKAGKNYLTDTLDTKGILRLIESIPSPKPEPFKLWLASLGSERIDEVFDPEIAVNRAVEYYRKRGYDDKWIKTRFTGIIDRFKLTDVWKELGITKDYMEYLQMKFINLGLA